MHVTLILILFTAVNAKKLRKDLPKQSGQEVIEDPNEVRPEIQQRPVIFSHVYRQGFGDTIFKQPVDTLDLDMVKPKNYEHAVELLDKTKDENIQLVPRHTPLRFLSPRDEMEYYKRFYNTTEGSGKQKLLPEKTNNVEAIYDFASILDRNLGNPFASRRSKPFEFKRNKNYPTLDKTMPRKYENVTDFFEENRFYRKQDQHRHKINWTTCDEFAKKALFHPNDIVNTKWLPFFIWSQKELSRTVVHTFSYPTKKNVQYFKTKYGPHVENIDWREPKLLLRERRSILLIAGDRKGLFYGIPEMELSDHPLFKNITINVIKLRLKVHDPYIAMMYCDDNYALIMAELGTEPKSEREVIQEASTLQFRGKGMPVYRNLVEEKFIADLEKKRKIAQEPKKFIYIPRLTGDVDDKVKH